MSARILVVDDVPANVKLLEARLSAEYFDVLTASNGAEALEICARSECDIILLDVMMPDMDGFEVCRRLKSNPATHFIPVVIVTALDSPADRVRGLEAGADDFLTKPVSDVVLIARVRSLTRLKMMTDELRMRAITSLEIGMEAPERSAVADKGHGGRILLVDDRPSSYERLAPILSAEHTVDVETNPAEALFHAADGQLRPADRLAQPGQFRRLAAVQPGALAGAYAPVADPRHLRRRQQCAAAARARNRRQRLPAAADRQERAAGARAHADPQAALHRSSARQCAELDRDGDHRRADRTAQPPLHGKPSGDAGRAGLEPRQAAGADDARHRLLQGDQRQLRPRRRRRRAARVRGAHPQVDPRHRSRLPLRRRGVRDRDAGNRPRMSPAWSRSACAARSPANSFAVSKGAKRIEVTISIGLSTLDRKGEPVADVLKRADTALYRAKNDGRNRVVSAAA